MTNFDSEQINPNYTVKVSNYLDRGWNIVREYYWGFISFIFLIALVFVALSFLPAPLGTVGEGQKRIATDLFNTVIAPVLRAGYFIVAFRIMKGRAHEFSDFFQGFRNFLQIFLVSLVGSLITIIGLVLLIIPGIYIGVCYLFGMCFVIEKRLDFWSALEASRKIVSRQWFSIFGFLLVIILINLGGALFCGIGLLVTVPWTACAIAAAFEDIVGLNQSDADADAISDSSI